ncbi:hypothetical protein F52700_4083 [Fusarium sp. NRRL 52700]|nr:hypothetical protein F52700_4083 [Fusarium sp. NRRL 52700]
MAPQDEQSRKRKSGETMMEAAVNVAPKSQKWPGILRRAGPDNSSEGDEHQAALKRQTDAPVPPTGASEERGLDRASGTSGTAPVDDLFRSTCAGCESPEHRLILCTKASLPDGLMKGCPWCNTLRHSLSNCPKLKDDLEMQLEVIRLRANMPSFQPTQEWVAIVRTAVAKGHSPPSSFPWTAQFTNRLRGNLFGHQLDLDRVGFNNREKLPIDPCTKDWETIQRKFPRFEGH